MSRGEGRRDADDAKRDRAGDASLSSAEFGQHVTFLPLMNPAPSVASGICDSEPSRLRPRPSHADSRRREAAGTTYQRPDVVNM